MLAEICERQDRWDEAIDQWREVARLRALEPTGLLKLAAAQIHQKQWAAAAATLKQLDKGWPSRFGDVDEQVRQLRERIERPK
jgi:TolA-binding protein